LADLQRDTPSVCMQIGQRLCSGSALASARDPACLSRHHDKPAAP
jgi:hypothetical protein